MKKLVLFLTGIVIFMNLATVASANQYDPYDGTNPSPDILIDKEVSYPYRLSDGSYEWRYAENLSSTDHRYTARDEFYFKLKVKNTSDVNLNNVMIKDFKPGYIYFIDDVDYGYITEDGKEFVINAGSFSPNQEKTYYIKAKVYNESDLPSDKSVICQVNNAKAYNNDVSDDDNAQYCLEHETISNQPKEERKFVNPPARIPETGTPLGALVMLTSAVSAAVGMRLRKIS